MSLGVASAVRERSTRAGKAPRRAYEHYFIESEGLHSRIHLQNFWSTFWPQCDVPATAHIKVFAADGTKIGDVDRTIPPFGSMFLETRDLLRELESDAPEGTVAIDLEPPKAVRQEFGELPKPAEVEIKTPYWMAYYDASENYMYVHSIETLGGEVYGAPKPLAWALGRNVSEGGGWRSWRLLDVDGLSSAQIVVINHSPQPRSTTVGMYSETDGQPLWQERFDFAPRQLRRVRVPEDELSSWAGRAEHARVGLDPLLTANGKPYVLLRYGHGALSLHHG